MPVHGAQRAAGERFANFTYESTPLVYSIIAHKARREFSRAMRFEEGGKPRVPPPGDPRPRLLYLHIPFCERLCPYCSFNRVTFKEELCRAYFRALRKELLLYRERGYDFGAIYAGAGHRRS